MAAVGREVPLGQLRVRASAAQAGRLVAQAAPWPERTWAVEGAGGLGCLLAQQLVAAGERVLDVQPGLGARVRLLATGASSKNDPGDARPVAIAALRSTAPRQVAAENHAAVLKVWSKRHRDLGRARTQVACRLHAVLCELVPGGISKEITAAQATNAREETGPSGAVQIARCELAAEFTGDLRRIDAQMRDTKKRLAVAVRAPGTTLTGVFGAGPVIAATLIGYVAEVSRFPSRDRFAACNGTAPIEVSSGNRKICRLSRRGNRRLNHAIHMAAVTQIRHPHSDGRACYDRKLAEGKTRKQALRCLKRRVSDAIYAHLQADARRAAAAARTRGPEGNRGTTLPPARPAHTPHTGSSAKPLPDPNPPYDPRTDTHLPVQRRLRRKPGKGLDAMKERSLPLPGGCWKLQCIRLHQE